MKDDLIRAVGWGLACSALVSLLFAPRIWGWLGL